MQRVKRGLLITFEGIEGSGKTTQIRTVSRWLKRKGFETVLTREPGGTALADRIRSMLLDSQTKRISAPMELFLYEVARRDHCSTVILPAMKKGKIVLCDRFTDATLAYQGYGRGLSLKIIEAMNRTATGGLKPDLTFLFDLPVETGLQRAGKRGRGLDRLERESKSFHRKVRNGYLTLARKEKRRFRVIHARESRREIFARICREVDRKLEKLH